jgi:protein-S-isoprenylcysteine O-methyltransferase Ste14
MNRRRALALSILYAPLGIAAIVFIATRSPLAFVVAAGVGVVVVTLTLYLFAWLTKGRNRRPE